MMKLQTKTVAAAAVVLAGAATAHAQAPDFGKREFESNCAVCHGKEGKGNGPYAGYLSKAAPDLTQMAKKNGGVFPLNRAYEVIEGAGPGHGTRDMPVWGRDYAVKAGEYYVDVPYNQEAYVRTRILALAEYLARMQVK